MGMSELPAEWIVTQLGQLLYAIEAGQNVKCEERAPKDGEAGLVKISAVTWGQFDEQASKTLPQGTPVNERNRIRPGDLLISRANTIELVGASVIVGPISKRLYLSDKVLRLVVDEPAKRWINYALKTPQVRQAIQAASTGNQLSMRNIPQEKLRSLNIPIAPAAEQTRIADQLDTLLARIKACNDHLDAIPGLLKRFRQAVLDAAVKGNLTASISQRAESATQVVRLGEDELVVPASWQVMDLQQVIDPARPLCYGVVQPGAETNDGVPLIRVQDMESGTILKSQLRTVSSGVDAEYRRSRVIGGEVLVSVVGTIGRTAVVPQGLCANIARAVARIACRADVASLWVHYWLSADLVQWHLLNSAKEVARKTLNLSDLARIPIALPGQQEQLLIIEKVAAYFRLAKKIESIVEAARGKSRRLAPLTLAKAFRGELVAQNPNDEPASVLLARLAKTPAVAVKAPRGRPRSKLANPSIPLPTVHPDWTTLPSGAWAAHAQPDEHATAAQLIAVLKAWGQPMPQDQARLMVLLCLQPRLFTAALPPHDASQWRRLVGAEADPLPTSVAALQPAVNAPWGRALSSLRARGDVVASGSGPQDTWTLGPGAEGVETAGWPDGRAAWVVAYLRAHGTEAVLPLLSQTAKDFVDARHAA